MGSSSARGLKSEAAEFAGIPEYSVSVIFSPYRICPIGAHIDHQGGPVTAMALDFGVTFAFAPCSSLEVKLRSRQYEGDVHFRVDETIEKRVHEVVASSVDSCNVASQEDQGPTGPQREESCWGNYARGAVWALKEAGHVLSKGLCGVISGEEGVDSAGVSSSAAVGVAYLLALATANLITLSKDDLIELDRRIENGFLGLDNGVLDQSAIVLSRKNQLTLIRCKDMTHETVPFASSGIPFVATGSCGASSSVPCACGMCSSADLQNKDELPFSILLAFSGVTAALTSTSGYNRRVRECREAAFMIQQMTNKLPSEDVSLNSLPVLGDLTRQQFEESRELLPSNLLLRAQHFFTECQRVEGGLSHWRAGDIPSFGKCVTESGQSSIENYECGIEPLTQLRAILLKAPGVLGARFSGAGFRGCCLALVWRCTAVEAAAFTESEYRTLQPELFRNIPGTPVVVCSSGDSARSLGS